MDARRFDAMTQELVAGGTRRAVGRMLAGSALVGGLAWLRGNHAAAACKKDGKKCDKNKDCCSKRCKGDKCRCLKAQKACPIGFAAKCCGALVCGANPCGEGGACCFPAGAVGCTSDCDCCGGPPLTICGGAPLSRFCCRQSGAGCISDSQCCSLDCISGGTCL